jgi:hypothetical protein
VATRETAARQRLPVQSNLAYEVCFVFIKSEKTCIFRYIKLVNKHAKQNHSVSITFATHVDQSASNFALAPSGMSPCEYAYSAYEGSWCR